MADSLTLLLSWADGTSETIANASFATDAFDSQYLGGNPVTTAAAALPSHGSHHGAVSRFLARRRTTVPLGMGRARVDIAVEEAAA